MAHAAARIRKAWIGAAALASALALSGGHGLAAETPAYPTKVVRVLTGYPPGGPTDLIGRVLTDHLSQALGQPFYVDGKPGLAGNIAGGILAGAPPDGYTLYIVGLGLVAVNADLYTNMSYDPAKAFAPITLLVNLPIVLETNAKVPVATYQDFVKYAKGGVKLNHGSPGIGTLPHLAAELFKSKIGFDSDHVAYRGTGPFATAMMQGEIQWAYDVTNTAITLRQNGFVRLLAVTSPDRYPSFPDVPTVTELGIPELTSTTWFGLVAPAGTPRPIIDKLHDEIERGWKTPEVAARLRNSGLDPTTTTPEETTKIFAADRAKWGAVVRANHIKAE
ncbi:MAG TPA: tripartite tricarboxylate transporter substrate-binding protein [Alphaproteobacteria bacterium]